MRKDSMGLELGLRPTSPVHVHVQDDAQVHVHVRKGTKKTRTSKTSLSSTSSVRRKPTKVSSATRIRNLSPSTGPWVPPPGKSAKGSKLSWQGRSHKLELSTPYDLRDASTDDEELMHGRVRDYEKKIDNLMSEVGTLKNEAALQSAMNEIEHKEDLLETSQRIIQKQEHELLDFQDELTFKEKENLLLRKSMDFTEDEVETSKDYYASEREKLMKKLIEVEMDGQSATQQVREILDFIRNFHADKRMGSLDRSRFTKYKESLVEKLADFDATNRILRRLLREHHHHESSSLRLCEQRDIVMKKLAEVDRMNERLRSELLEKDRFIVDLKHQTASQREENVALVNLQGTLENTRGHLQKQLRTKEADNNRMAVQIRTLESQVSQDKIDLDHLSDIVENAKGKSDRDKDSLKKATRRIEELEYLVEKVEETARSSSDNVVARLHEKSSEVSSLTLENERLKSAIVHIERKFQIAEDEMTQLRQNLQQCETRTNAYKDQRTGVVRGPPPPLDRSRRDVDDTAYRLEERERESMLLQKDGELELEKVKIRLHSRLQELEPLPELLRSSELKLHDATEQLLHYERRNSDNTKLIGDLTNKIEQMTGSMDQMQGRVHNGQDENRGLSGKVDTVEKKLRQIEDENRDLLSAIAKREESIHQNNLHLEEKSRENSSVTRQLENALTDLRQMQEQSRDRMSSKERTYQTRISDLESQLSQFRTEIARIKREKEENERKFNSRMYDLKDRLEQSHSTNRSMQNYVQFLKNSYANVFGDRAVGMPSSPIRSALP